MGEGQHTRLGAAPRSLSELRREIFEADQAGDEARVSALRAEISRRADQSSHLEEGGKRGR